MENEEPQQSEGTKPETSFQKFKKKYEDVSFIGKLVLAVLGLLLGAILTLKGVDYFGVGKAKSIAKDILYCTPNDVLSGTIQLDNQPVVGAIILFKAHNENTDDFEEKENMIKVQDGTFKFAYCRANTDKVEFKIIFDANTKYTKPYSIDSIPTIINLN